MRHVPTIVSQDVLDSISNVTHVSGFQHFPTTKFTTTKTFEFHKAGICFGKAFRWAFFFGKSFSLNPPTSSTNDSPPGSGEFRSFGEKNTFQLPAARPLGGVKV